MLIIYESDPTGLDPKRGGIIFWIYMKSLGRWSKTILADKLKILPL